MDPSSKVGYSQRAISWSQVFISGCSILINVVFLWRNTSKRREQNTTRDLTLQMASTMKILIGAELTIRKLVILYDQQDIYKFLGSVDLLIDGLYLSTLLIRNVFRCLVLRKIQLPQNTQDKSRSKNIKKSLFITTPIVVLMSFVYGIMIGLPEGHSKGYFNSVVYSVHVLVKQVPFILITCLSIMMSGKFGYVLYKRRQTVHPRITSNNSVGYHQTLKQSLLVVVFQLVFFVLPGCFVYSNELIGKTFVEKHYQYGISNEAYWMMRCILDVFSPLVFGPPKLRHLMFALKRHQDARSEIEANNEQTVTSHKQNLESENAFINGATQPSSLLSSKKKVQLEALKMFTITTPDPQSPVSRKSLYSIYSLKSPLPYSPHSLNSYPLLPPISPSKSDNDTKQRLFLNTPC